MSPHKRGWAERKHVWWWERAVAVWADVHGKVKVEVGEEQKEEEEEEEDEIQEWYREVSRSRLETCHGQVKNLEFSNLNLALKVLCSLEQGMCHL